MKKLLVLIVVGITLLVLSNSALAEPFLQLDISDGVYVGGGEKTVFATDEEFALYGLVNSKKGESGFENDTYYIAASIVPDPGQIITDEFGSFEFNGTTYDLDDMVYGKPDGIHQTHGIYDTYYKEFDFTLDLDKRAAMYNVQDNPGSLTSDPDGPLYYMDFLLDVNGLADGYELHFDLYTKNDDGSMKNFAPFSHDAQSGGTPPPPGIVVPEPSTILLLGFGLIGIFGLTRKFEKR